jgi:hypothetical protein
MRVRRLVIALSLPALLVFAPGAGAARSAAAQSVQITASATASWIVLGDRIGIRGAVKPHAGGLRVTLEQRVEGSWRVVDAQPARTNGAFTFSAHPGRTGRATYRVVLSAATGYTGSSDDVVVRVLRWTYLGDIYTRPAVGDLDTETIVSDAGVHFEHPVALDPGCYNAWGGDAWVDYPLGKQYELLTATVGLAGYTEPGTTASFQVNADGKTLASGNLAVGGAMQKIKVSLDGIGKLRIRINVPDPTNAGGCSASYTQVVFGNAQVLGP